MLPACVPTEMPQKGRRRLAMQSRVWEGKETAPHTRGAASGGACPRGAGWVQSRCRDSAGGPRGSSPLTARLFSARDGQVTDTGSAAQRKEETSGVCLHRSRMKCQLVGPCDLLGEAHRPFLGTRHVHRRNRNRAAEKDQPTL